MFEQRFTRGIIKCVNNCIVGRCASSRTLFEDGLGGRLEDLLFREPVEPVELDTDEEDLTPFYDGPDEPEEPELGSPRQPLESVESVDSPGTHTLPHTVSTRTVYQIITQLRAVDRRMWQLRARINCNKGDLLVNTTMSVSSLLPIPQQEAMANFTSTP
jgi:hypothetical protein